MDLKVYHCEICGNILTPLYDAKVVPFCCGQKMAILTANTQDAAYEKHVPAVEVNGNQVSIQIGSVLHPSVEAHYIMFIILVTTKGYYVRHLEPGQKPAATFALAEEKPLFAFEYCNLHGLWKTEIK